MQETRHVRHHERYVAGKQDQMGSRAQAARRAAPMELVASSAASGGSLAALGRTGPARAARAKAEYVVMMDANYYRE